MNEYYGMISIFLSATFSSTATMFAKLASYYIHPFDFTIIRMTSQFIIMTFLCYLLNVNPSKEPFIKHQIGRGVLGSLAFTFIMWGTAEMEMSNATILKFAGNLFTIVLAKFYLKENVSNLKQIVLLIGFLGVFLVAKPSFIFGSQTHKDYPSRSFAVFAVIFGSFCFSVSVILTKTIINRVHTFSLIWYFSAVSMIVTFPLQFFKSSPSIFINLHYVALMVIFFLSAQLLQNIGLKLIPASVVTLVQISDTLFGVIYGVFVFEESLDIFSYVGCVCVLSVSIMLAIEKYYETKQAKYVILPHSEVTKS